MCERTQASVKKLTDTLRVLEPLEGKTATPPKPETWFETFNGSLVYVTGLDDDGDGRAVVIVGGHGCKGARGKAPGESYLVRRDGYYTQRSPGPEIGMSLLREVRLDLSAWRSPRG